MHKPFEIAATIKLLAKQQDITVKNLLEDCQINKGFLYDLEHKSAYPSCDKVSRIADRLSCSVDYLLGRTNISAAAQSANSSYDDAGSAITPMIIEASPGYDASSEHTISILGYVAAGEPILSYENKLTAIAPENKRASYALIADGDSMSPVIKNGEIIEVLSRQDLETGEIGIIKVNNAVTCKRFYEFEDHYELRSLNPDFDAIVVPKSPENTVQIIGKVALTRIQKSRYNSI